MMSVVVVFIILAVFLEMVFVFSRVTAKSKTKQETQQTEEISYDMDNIDGILRSLGYNLCSDSDEDYYKNLDNVVCLYVTMSKYGVIGSLSIDSETIEMPEEELDSIEEEALTLAELEGLDEYGELSALFPDAIEFLIDEDIEITSNVLICLDNVLLGCYDKVNPILKSYYEEELNEETQSEDSYYGIEEPKIEVKELDYEYEPFADEEE